MVNKTHKILSILQLCLSFSLFLGLIGDPFIGQHFRTRTDMLMIENIRGDTPLMERSQTQEKAKLKSNYLRWKSLPLSTQIKIDQAYDLLKAKIEIGFADKLLEGAYHLLVKTPFYELAWVFFAILIPILCLKGRAGAENTSIILPLIVLLYAGDEAAKKPCPIFFPTEQEIVTKYLKKSLSADLASQKSELLHGFDLYLIQKWAKKTPSSERERFIQQRDEGEFYFTLMQLEKKMATNFEFSPHQEHSFMLFLYLGWNLLYCAALTQDKWKPFLSKRVFLNLVKPDSTTI